MTFSNRTSWHRQTNKLTQALELCKSQSKLITDLTATNPTEGGFTYPAQEILSAISTPQSLCYTPDPHGLRSAREAIAGYYKKKNISVNPENIFLTASTSEAYSYIFKLLCNAGESVLVPQPSYPLFEYLAQVNDVTLQSYRLLYDHGWHIDIDSLNHCSVESLKAIIIVNPHNPTGMFLKQNEYEAIKQFALEHHLALIVDEVFVDYNFDSQQEIISTAIERDVLTFTLNGISKMCGLPQMKLGWFVVSGGSLAENEAIERLEILSDTFLSVNTPVQFALPTLLEICSDVQMQIRNRIISNYSFLESGLNRKSKITPLQCAGGWYAILRVPSIKSDEEWAIELLERCGVVVHPGYFFDFEQEGYLVVSLLVKETGFRAAIKEIITHIDANA
ncbi:MAG: pyridoxal phosphate-dependent aminotransferase [Bacteroidetes bacterium]|nr:MAG: pyridoxal phosphate-dependent aminotransferase [Bacteroidota bacterium]